jgi:hypothetical protein
MPQAQGPPPLRTKTDQLKLIERVVNLRSDVRAGIATKTSLKELTTETGVVGPCPLTRLPYFDPIRDCPIDMMHTGTLLQVLCHCLQRQEM